MNTKLGRLMVLWLTTALVAGGCAASGSNLPVVERNYIAATLVLIVAVMLLLIVGLRNAQRRGTFLGIIFGAMAQIVIARRVPSHLWMNFLIAGICIIVSILLFGLVTRITAKVPRQAVPNTGLVAYFTTASLLLMLDIILVS